MRDSLNRNLESEPSLWQRLVRAHPSETDLHYTRVLELVAGWHLVTIPLGPMLAAMQVLAGEAHRVRLLWLVVAPVMTFVNYLVTRSRIGRQALWFQVACTFGIVAYAMVLSPDRAQTTFALILPVLAAALCFGVREVLLVQAAALSMVVVSFFQAAPDDRGRFIGIGVVLIAAFAIIAALVRHRIWLHNTQVAILKAEAQRSRALLDASFDGTALVEEGVLREVGQGFADALGTEISELEGRPVAHVLPGPLDTERGQQDAVPYLDPQGSLRYLGVIRQELRGQSSFSEVIAVRDQTHEAIHRANILFMDRMASIGTLASGVAHEVNNALTALVGTTEIVEISLTRGDTDGLKGSLANIQNAAERISDCMSQLQTFGSPDEASPTLVDINEIVSSTVGLSRHQMRHLASLETDLGNDLPDCIAVESWVAQILMNLLLNSRDAVQGKPDAQVGVTTRTENGMLAVRVYDNGPGVSPELAERIFQPFFTTKAGKGSGLGLSLSAGIASRMGGSLTLEATQEGACFCLWLPVTVREGLEEQPPAGLPEPRATQRILLVDDEDAVLDVLVELFRPAMVSTATSMGEAQAKWSDDYDMILSDIVMPGGTGLELREWVERMHPEMLERFVLMTGSAVGLDQPVRELPPSQIVLQKPLPRARLLNLLAGLTRQHS